MLVHAFPDASIPVVQLSINADKPFDYHLTLGTRLAPLRESGVLVIGSGNVVHNLGGMNWDLVNDGYDWAQRFDTDAKQQMLTNPTEFDAQRPGDARLSCEQVALPTGLAAAEQGAAGAPTRSGAASQAPIAVSLQCRRTRRPPTVGDGAVLGGGPSAGVTGAGRWGVAHVRASDPQGIAVYARETWVSKAPSMTTVVPEM